MQYTVNASGCYYMNGTQFIGRGLPDGAFIGFDWTILVSALFLVAGCYMIFRHLGFCRVCTGTKKKFLKQRRENG